VAVLISSFSAAAGFAACPDIAMASGFEPGSPFGYCWDTPELLISESAKTRTAICVIKFLSTDFIGSPRNCESQGLKPRPFKQNRRGAPFLARFLREKWGR